MKQVKLPKVSERIIGATLPKNGSIYICDYDEVFKIQIGSESKPEILDDEPYEFLSSSSHSLGIYEHTPILKFNNNSINYDFNPIEDYVMIKYDISGNKGEIKFRTFSGDWFSASFSECGEYLMMAEPYCVSLYHLA